MEVFMSWYSASHWEFFMMWNRMFGPMGWAYWLLILTNIAIPLTTLWSRRLRVSPGYLFFLSFVVNIGMWFERFVIIVLSLNRDFLPSSWGYYRPTIIDVGTFMGTIGIFFAAFLLFMRWLPMVAMAEVKGTMPQADPHFGHKHGDHDAPHAEPVAAAKGTLAAEGAE
jgi:Ni/Fe-hydrogenase subunit HybB-like protein